VARLAPEPQKRAVSGLRLARGVSMIERIDKSRIAGLAGTDLNKYVESDFKIRSGLCPNGHGLMTADDGGQRCPTCGFWTNKRAELERQ